MNQEQIDRINALYRKSKAEGLTEEEKKEQALLRKQYVADVKKNLAAQLNNIDMVNLWRTLEISMEKRQDFPDAALTQEKARQQIRARHKAWRMELPQEEVQEKSRKICERLAASDWYHNSAVIYGYYPLGAEADCLPFLAQALSDGKTVALPVTSKERLQRDCGREKRMQDTHRMEFYRIRELSRVREGAFHVMEPDESCKRIGGEDAVVLVPGLVFDRKGNRYGYGGGYYDRYFARFPKLSRMAVAFEGQIEEQLAVLPTDVRMHRIYTEEREYRI